jgi:hypothetical protein
VIKAVTDPIQAALADLDTQVSAIGDASTAIETELSTVVTLVQQLQAELAAGNDPTATASAIEQRVTALQPVAAALAEATTAAQSALNPPDSGSTPAPAATADTSVSNAPQTGSAMG